MKRREWRAIAQALALLSQLGLTIVVAILLGGGVGTLLSRAGLGAAGLILGILLGIGGAGVGAWGLLAPLIEGPALAPGEDGRCLPKKEAGPDPAGAPGPSTRSSAP